MPTAAPSGPIQKIVMGIAGAVNMEKHCRKSGKSRVPPSTLLFARTRLACLEADGTNREASQRPMPLPMNDKPSMPHWPCVLEKMKEYPLRHVKRSVDDSQVQRQKHTGRSPKHQDQRPVQCPLRAQPKPTLGGLSEYHNYPYKLSALSCPTSASIVELRPIAKFSTTSHIRTSSLA